LKSREGNSLAEKSNRRGGKSATIQEVARHAGVSPMTVSRVVNGEAVVREDTVKKVMASIKALRYSPNPAARSLAGAKSIRIGLLHSNPSAAYLSEFLVGSLEQSSASGCQLILEKCDGASGEQAAIVRLAQSGADGVILPPPLCDSAEALQAVLAEGIPGVIVATGHPASQFSAISIDDFAAARAMTRKLISLGHTRIAFIAGHPNQTASARRHEGFLSGMEEAGLIVAPAQLAQGYFTYRSGLEAAELLLGANPKPTAIFASNDDMAAAAISVAHRLGLDVPRDVSVAGFDDTTLATAIWPALTTIHQPVAKMASEAVKLLINQIRHSRSGEKTEVVHRLLEFTLISRESTTDRKRLHPGG
jgi:LacI family transcriptional regulator